MGLLAQALGFATLAGLLQLLTLAAGLILWPGPDPVGPRLAAAAADAPLNVMIEAVALFALLLFIQAWPRWWWAALALAAAAFSFAILVAAPVYLLPAQRHDAPAQAGGAILAFVQRGGLAADRLYVYSGRDPADVDMEGFPGQSHAAVSRAALAASTPQTFAAIGHLLGHHHYGDVFSMALLWSAAAFGVLFAAARGAGPLGRRLRSVPPGQGGAGADLPAMALIVWALLPVLAISFNVFDQAINYRADAYALSLTRDPRGLCEWLIGQEGGDAVAPGAIATLLFYDHPPLKSRLVQALGHQTLAPKS